MREQVSIVSVGGINIPPSNGVPINNHRLFFLGTYNSGSVTAAGSNNIYAPQVNMFQITPGPMLADGLIMYAKSTNKYCQDYTFGYWDLFLHDMDGSVGDISGYANVANTFTTPGLKVSSDGSNMFQKIDFNNPVFGNTVVAAVYNNTASTLTDTIDVKLWLYTK